MPETIAKWSTVIVLNPFARMSISYPSYYYIFTERGPICGTLLQRNRPCEPTYVVYDAFASKDQQSVGRGSSPAPVHVSGYARGGWIPAVLTLVFASIALGAFCAVPFRRSALFSAIFITGCIAGYHWSQIPWDGPIRYEHGIMYSFAMAAALAVMTCARRRFAAKLAASP